MEANMVTLLGGVTYNATKLDGSIEEVRIAQVPIKSFPDYLNAQEDEPRMVEMFCGKPKGWSDQLTPGSFEHIIAEGERINADFFSRWVQRRLARQEKLMPGITEKLLASRTTLPNSPSKPA
jgi:hypothetical protein